MKRRTILFALALQLPGSVFAATSTAKPAAVTSAAARPATPLPLTPGMHRVLLSPEGNAMAQKIFGTPDPRAAQIQAEFVAIKQDQAKLVATRPVDVDKIASIMQRAEALQGEIMKAKDDRLLTLLRALSESDRMALLQQIFNPAQPQNSRPAAAAAPASTGH